MVDSAATLMERLDAIAQDASTKIERIVFEALGAIRGTVDDMRSQTVILARSLERQAIVETLAPLDGAAAPKARPSPPLPPDGPAKGGAPASFHSRPATKAVILRALVEGGGSLPKSVVLDRVLGVGLSEDAYNKARGRLKASGLMVEADGKAAWAVTDLGRREVDGSRREVRDADEEGGGAMTDG